MPIGRVIDTSYFTRTPAVPAVRGGGSGSIKGLTELGEKIIDRVAEGKKKKKKKEMLDSLSKTKWDDLSVEQKSWLAKNEPEIYKARGEHDVTLKEREKNQHMSEAIRNDVVRKKVLGTATPAELELARRYQESSPKAYRADVKDWLDRDKFERENGQKLKKEEKEQLEKAWKDNRMGAGKFMTNLAYTMALVPESERVGKLSAFRDQLATMPGGQQLVQEFDERKGDFITKTGEGYEVMTDLDLAEMTGYAQENMGVPIDTEQFMREMYARRALSGGEHVQAESLSRGAGFATTGQDPFTGQLKDTYQSSGGPINASQIGEIVQTPPDPSLPAPPTSPSAPLTEEENDAFRLGGEGNQLSFRKDQQPAAGAPAPAREQAGSAPRSRRATGDSFADETRAVSALKKKYPKLIPTDAIARKVMRGELRIQTRNGKKVLVKRNGQ